MRRGGQWNLIGGKQSCPGNSHNEQPSKQKSHEWKSMICWWLCGVWRPFYINCVAGVMLACDLLCCVCVSLQWSMVLWLPVTIHLFGFNLKITDTCALVHIFFSFFLSIINFSHLYLQMNWFKCCHMTITNRDLTFERHWPSCGPTRVLVTWILPSARVHTWFWYKYAPL